MFAEGVHPFKSTVGPFNLNGPSVSISKHDVEYNLLRNIDHYYNIATNHEGDKALRLGRRADHQVSERL
jgi:hypothetical protein